MEEEFQEIGHCGGTVTFTISTSQDGGCQFQVTIQHSRNNAAGFFAVYAIPQGVAVDTIQLGADLITLQSKLKCGTECGSCVPELKRLVLQHSKH